MKTQLLSAVLVSAALLAGSFAYAQDAKKVNTLTKEIAIKSDFEAMTVGSGIELVLVQDDSKPDILVTGDENFVKYVNVNINRGLLSISSKKDLKNKQVRVYVPVTDLTSLDLAAYASVTSEGIVKLKGLKVMVHAGSKVALNILGDFQIESGDDCDFVYEKHEIAKVIYVHQ